MLRRPRGFTSSQGWHGTSQSGLSVKDFGFRHRGHVGDQLATSRPTPSRQSRNASKTTLGVQDNIMPKKTACKVVMDFRSRRYCCSRLSVLDYRRLPARVPLCTMQHYYFCISQRIMANPISPAGLQRRNISSGSGRFFHRLDWQRLRCSSPLPNDEHLVII